MSPRVDDIVVPDLGLDGWWRSTETGASVPPVFAGSRVVVVDDVDANVALLRRVLTGAGVCSVDTYTNPIDALKDCLDCPPDLILLDLHMPGLDGMAFLEALRRELPADAFVPVIMLTADSTQEARQNVLTAGAKDFLTKPFDSVEVLLRVRNMLETTHLYRAVSQQNAYLQAVIDEKTVAERHLQARRRRLRETVEEAITSDALSIVFQPIVDIATGTVVGVEALARFSSEPIRPPNEWFADAAEVGLGTKLELIAVSKALNQLSTLPPAMFMSVNVSPATAITSDLAILTSIDPKRIVVELTEYVPIDNDPAIIGSLHDLRRQGVRIAVDDTGAGYAGLALLVQLSPDIIKLDRYLISGITRDPCRRALASAFVAFSLDIGAALIAEGIEDADELALLRHLGVPLGQGFHLGRPQALPTT
jgi:EAL domain-containing protein (putative c-di-GMP-specific phosphodiesterase class I)/FixJ family two-component response regulator